MQSSKESGRLFDRDRLCANLARDTHMRLGSGPSFAILMVRFWPKFLDVVGSEKDT